ncbi:MAG: CotH kinase family protein, partial [Bacteroidota bacterium]
MKKYTFFLFIMCLFVNLLADAQGIDNNIRSVKYSDYDASQISGAEQVVPNNQSSLLDVVFTSSNLPIIVINTNNVTIPDSPKIPAHMGIIYNGPGVRNYMTDSFNNYNNNIGIELRGSTSQSFPQKPYGLETRDSSGLQHDTIVLQMPEENDWILYPPYDDKTCMRNTLVYDLANKTGHYAVRTKFCELVLNGNYQGIYVWMEKIKHDQNRVDIAKMDTWDTLGDALTGGYIFKIDKTTGSGGSDGWNSTYLTDGGHTLRFLYEYPAYDAIVVPQENYIRAYVDSFEVALKSNYFADPVNGYRKYIDVNSFIDYFLLSEFTRNVDSYRLSTFLYKQRNSEGRKIVCGPVWDYNIALGNADYNNGASTSGWAYVDNENFTGDDPFWWAWFMQNTSF